MFKIGDIVKLKSSGPAMTTQKVDGGKATCIWFKDDRLKSAIFRKDTIELVTPATNPITNKSEKAIPTSTESDVIPSKKQPAAAKVEKSKSSQKTTAKSAAPVNKNKSGKPKKAAIDAKPATETTPK